MLIHLIEKLICMSERRLFFNSIESMLDSVIALTLEKRYQIKSSDGLKFQAFELSESYLFLPKVRRLAHEL